MGWGQKRNFPGYNTLAKLGERHSNLFPVSQGQSASLFSFPRLKYAQLDWQELCRLPCFLKPPSFSFQK